MVLGKPLISKKVVLIWTPEAKMKGGCVKSTQERTIHVETECQALNLNIAASLVASKRQRGIEKHPKSQITK